MGQTGIFKMRSLIHLLRDYLSMLVELLLGLLKFVSVVFIFS